jgi:Glycerol dehydrogenase and related enzymes
MSYYDFQTVPRYIQCENVLREFKRLTYGLGKKFLILTACGPITDLVKQEIIESLESTMVSRYNEAFALQNHKYSSAKAKAEEYDEENQKIDYSFVDYEKIPLTRDTAKGLADDIEKQGFDVVVGIGGGKALDFVRAARHYTPIKMVLVPTVAATNASATNLCVIYNAEGTEITDHWALRECQELVLADPKLLIGAPARTLSAGIGDTISTYFEALNAAKRTGNKGYYAASTWAYIEASIELLYQYGPEAYQSAKSGNVSPAYEAVVSLILHSVGPIRAGCVSGVGHIIDEGLLSLPPCKKRMHGELVGYGVLPMMLFDEEPKEKIERYIKFCIAVGIPVCFEDLGISGITESELEKAFDVAVNGTMIRSFPYLITRDELVQMTLKAETFVTSYLKKQ